jgi:hypothetical protein
MYVFELAKEFVQVAISDLIRYVADKDGIARLVRGLLIKSLLNTYNVIHNKDAATKDLPVQFFASASGVFES